MAIDVSAVRNWVFPDLRQSYTEKDTILYALALGYGSQPQDRSQLAFVYEDGLQVVPTMTTTLCHPGFWISDPRTGIDASRAVHGEHRVSFHTPLPPHGCVRGRTRVADIVDKGRDKGALLIFERTLHDDSTGALLATIEHHTLCRADGGFSGVEPARAAAAPRRAEAAHHLDHVVDIDSLPQAALIYRLSADPNPLHADPDVARKAGFPRPILHGLCTYGIACRGILQACAPREPGRLESLAVRFSAPVFPGETLRTEIWNDGVDSDGRQGLGFRCLVPQRNTVVISNGRATLAAAT